VSYGGVATKKSPYRLMAVMRCNPKQVRVSGPGVVENGVLSTKATHFTIDTRAAGHSESGLAISITDENGKGVPYNLHDNMDGVLTVEFI